MPLDFLNIVPANNLRLPDALNVTYGPARELSRFVLAADRAARRKGVFLRVRYDFDELLYANRQYTARGTWYPLVDGFNPERSSSVTLQLKTGLLALKELDSGWAPAICKILVRKDRISALAVLAAQNPPKCVCEIRASESTENSLVCR